MRKRERHTLYKRVLEAVRLSHCGGFMCIHIAGLAEIEINQLPELWEQRPRRVNKTTEAWWNTNPYGKRKRIECLKKAILLSRPKRKK